MSTQDQDDLQAVLTRSPRRQGLPTSTAVLAAIALLAVGFLGGLLVGRQTASSGGTAAPGGFQKGFPTPSGAAMPGSGGGVGGGGTVGTVTRVDGDTIYVETADGSTVKVVVGDDTTIQVSEEGSLTDISEGSTVFVRGTTTDGELNATSITEGELGFVGPGAPSPGASGSGA
ncbi:MAG: hypothetical protein AB1551_02890 [Actinomycetota bacterium]